LTWIWLGLESKTDEHPGQTFRCGKIFELPVDILIPAAISDVITKKNVNKVKAKKNEIGCNKGKMNEQTIKIFNLYFAFKSSKQKNIKYMMGIASV